MYSKRKKIQQHDLVFDNTTRDNIPKRGYYSELVSELSKDDPTKDVCTKKRMKLILQAKTDKLAPMLVSLPKPQRPKLLLPPGRWTTYREDESIQFPFETFVPKLQFLSIVLPKELPRLVKIERLRRKFLAANIKKMLRELGIQPYWLLPIEEFKVTDQEHYGLYSPFPKLDLEVFDNTDFDCRVPEEWMSLGLIEGEQYPCPGLAFIPKDDSKPAKPDGDIIQTLNNQYEWTNVAAMNYDKVTDKWDVMALDGTKRRYTIPRIRLMFKADDPETFAQRIKFAVEFRKEVENNLRFYLYLDCLLLEGLPMMPLHNMPKIIRMVRIHRQAKELDEDHVNALKSEAELLYRKMEGKMKIIYTIQKYKDLYNFINVPTKDYVAPVPDYGRHPCVMEDFHGRLAFNQWHSLYVLTESVACIHLVVDECLKVESMLFFTANYGRNASLAEFDAAQQHCTSMMLKYLNISWLNQTAHAIRMSFRDVGKGWFNIYEKKWEFYGVSKLARFMQLVRFRMQYALRFCIEQSMLMLVSLLETPCLCTYWCPDNYEWDSSDLINSPFRSPTVTLFYFHLMMSEKGPYYTTDPNQFEVVIQRLFREMLYRCHFIPQVHPMIMTGLVFDKELFLTSIGLMEPNVVEYRERLLKAYRRAIIPLLAYMRQYACYREIYVLDIEKYVENFRSEKHSASETREEVQIHYDAKQDLIWRLPQLINIGPFSINVDSLKQLLVNKRSDIIKALLIMWAEEVRLIVDDVIAAYKGIMRKLGEKPNTIEHVFEIREWMESIPFALKTQDDIMRKVHTDYEVLDNFFMPLENDDFKALWEAIGWPLQITKQVDATIEFLEEEQEKFWKLHMQDEQTLYDKIDMFTAQCMTLTLQNDFSKVHEIANDIKKAWKAMKDAQDWGRILNQRQKLFGQPVVPFSDLNKLVKEFEPYRNLWVTASDFLKAREVWLDNPLMYVDADTIEPLVNECYKTIIKCVRTFADLPKVQQVAITIRDDIDSFRPLIPIIQAVRNPGMKERHWNEFMDKAGITVTMNEKQTFQMCMKQGVAAHGQLIADIGELASKEYVIEQSLDKMQAEWANKVLEMTPYKTTGTFIMKIADETLQLLDEHLLATQQLGFSPFKAAFELRIQEWDDKLRLTQKVVDEWIECQKEWMYLEPIFTSEDISRQLPLEAKKYGTMERIWRRIMSSAAACPKIMIICPDSRLLDSLLEAIHLLSVVSRGLNEYMELKRLRFPRFFFLSDDELLEILSQSRNPRAVQPHLRKCFENIAKVTFQHDLKITHMHSSEGEVVELKYQFFPTSNVEQWLLLLEDTMRHSIRLTLVAGLEELWLIPRAEWVLRWPGQVVIAGSQTAWTAGVEAAIDEYRMDEYFHDMLQQLDTLRALVKGDLTFFQREVLCALIVVEVHARDVTHTLVEENVRNVADFQWICQLRYYQIVKAMYPLEAGESPDIYQDEHRLDTSAYYRQFSQNHCDVKALNSVFTYQNEYLGNSGRLVITPLTDRCYLTLMCAMHLKFGGAPAGPAGTGKTETTKDLAKALAVQCVVFNCSDQLDFMAMGKFFKGLAASGAWACFDEFNRIDIEVLSVVAQQVATIQKAQLARQDRFMFEGVDLPLKASCSVFITMNPGYAGRTELPDNLKALFRPIAMMVPDYALIAEISLFSFGFSEAKILAGKITTTFRLSSEQLSAQDHYDFGMRAVKTVITVAGNLIRQMPDGDERQIVLRALRDVNVPKFLADDLVLFNGIISDLFPRVEIPIVDYGIMEQSIRIMLTKKGYDDLYSFIFKVIQLYETTVVRHGLMVVGPAGAGKTKCYETLRDALTAIKGKPAPDGFPFTPVHTFVVNPKSITMGQLYGEFDLQTHEWTDGILSSLVRAGIAVEDMDKRWYVFDGPVDAVWIENMNTVLDDNKKLCLSSGEIMKLTDRQRMIFEVADLAVASPATVSRCGMVYLDAKVVGLPPLVNAWIKSNLPPTHKRIHLICHVFTLYLLIQTLVGLTLFNVIPIWINYASGNFEHTVLQNATYEYSIYLYLPDYVYTHQDAYIPLCVVNWFISYITSTLFCALDLLLSLMVFHLWGHIKILLHDIETFPLPANKEIVFNKDSVLTADMYSEEEQKQVSEKLKECIDYHRLIIDYTKIMSNAFGPMLFIYYMFHQVCLCLLLLECSQMTAEALIRYLPLSVILCQQLIQVSVIFELIGSTSEKLKDAVYSMPWQCMNSSNRRTVCIFLVNVQKPIHIKALGMMDVGVRSMAAIADPIRKGLLPLIQTYLYPALELLRSHLVEIVVSIDCALVLKFLELLDYRLRPLTGKDDRPPPPANFLALMPRLAPLWVVWAVIWSVGATCDHNGRVMFSDFIRKTTADAGLKPLFPDEGRVYDYTLHDGGFTDPTEDGEPGNPYWYSWMAKLPTYVVDPEWQYADIEVPTMDNVRSAAILGYKIVNYNHVICVGPTGTGKTVTIHAKLSRGLHRKFICEFLVFSARTSANQTQDVIDGKLERRRRGVFGPPPTKRQVFFIDDLNMPALEVFGAQPPIELLRQFMDFGGWYDRDNIGEFKMLVDVGIVAAMGPPGGGRNPVTMRLMRHFHYISFTEMEYSSKYLIFEVILKSWTKTIDPKVTIREPPFLKGSIEIFNSLVEELLPTPTKSHYTFNLRDLSKVFQGILMMDPKAVHDEDDVIRLWYHEHQRVYQDRLVNDEDREWFVNLINNKVRSEFGKSAKNILADRMMLFGDFMDLGTDDKKYVEIVDKEELTEVLAHYLEEYNMATTAPLDLVLFEDAVAHLCRVARIMRQPMANALLLGMGGSGRQSLSRLASNMAELACFQIEITKAYGVAEWRDDLRQTMMKAGVENRGIVFLFSDAQIKMESFLEDLNNILSSGDVPNIYEVEDLDKIYQAVRHAVMEMNLTATKANLYACFQRRVRSNLHIVIVMSPIGEVFRARLRQFPSLVNCCTIDWFSEWPKTALESVAYHFFEGMGELTTATDEVLHAMVSMTCFVHQTVVDASAHFKEQLNRINYVTPMSYMEMLGAYAEMFQKKQKAILKESNALKTGLDKLNQTEVEVKQLQIELAELKPLMEKAAEETRQVIAQIATDTAIAEEAREKVEKETVMAEKMAAINAAMTEDAQRDLEEALPALRAAEKALQELNRNDVVEVKAMKKPPAGVVLVIESLCVVFDIKPIKEQGAAYGEKVLNYWRPGSAMLADPTAFLDSLLKFDKESITEDMIKKLKRFVVNPDYDPVKIVKVSKACQSLCMWVHAMYKFYHVNKGVAPKKEALARATRDLAIVEAMLANAKAKMIALLEGIAKLNAYLVEKEEERKRMEEDINLCLARMDRANRLLNGLSSERVRWIKTIKDLSVAIVNLIGDILLSACAVGYITPFTDEFRRDLLSHWISHLVEVKLPHSPGATPLSVLGDAVQIRTWQMYGLPRDPMSVESAVLMSNSRRWPLIIDPQTQANKWIRAMGKLEGLVVCKPNDRDLLRNFESALRFGKPILLENVGQELDPALDPVLKRQYFRQAGQLVLKLGDSLIPFMAGFRLYITTKLPNPKYTPETSVKVMVVNFALVPSGLAEQLLSIVVAQERPDLEELRGQLIVSRAQMAAQLAEMQADILYGLSNSEGSPVDDLPLILTLEAIKIKSAEILIKVEDIERTTLEIDEARSDYVPVANRGQILFFCLSDMSNVDPMYQYSLEWFVKLFVRSMAETEPNEDIVERVDVIIVHFTFLLYQNVCRSLFERHKLLFAFLLCARILLDKGVIRHTEFNYFLNGAKLDHELENPEPKWISPRMWLEMQQLATVPTMSSFLRDFTQHSKYFKTFYDSYTPHKLPYPKPLDTQLDSFQKLLVLKCIRPDKLIPGLQDYVVMGLGARFVEPQPADLAALYAESDPLAPIIFVLSTGTDPAADLLKFADKMKMGKRFESISLGQGQGPLAEAMMRVGCDFGNWVFFQNCHLSPSWMPVLELNVEHITPELVHKDFRLWLTSTPSPHFPVALLQNGYKMTVEPPRGIKANLLKAFMNQVPDFLEYFNSQDAKVPNFKWLLFSLCLFHGVVLERRKFGPLGFNIPYEFTDGDLRICISQLHMFLNEYAEVPLRMLTYTAGHINYGGRVTDDWDRRCLLCLLGDYYTISVLTERYIFDESGAYRQQQPTSTIDDYTRYIRTLPLNDDPSLFGLHTNANISYAMSETSNCIATLRDLQPKEIAVAGGMTIEQMTELAAKDILHVLPEPLDAAHIAATYPVSYKESLNTVLIQEAIRYNKLIAVINQSLKDLLKALKGLVVMSEALENMTGSLAKNLVPLMWSSKAYPSLKPLAAWVKDLCLRVQFMQDWQSNGIPKVFWISGFYFPQAFLTGALQNYARKHVIAIDTVAYAFEALNTAPQKKPEDGCCVRGMYLEGARWNAGDMSLEESRPKELHTEMAIIYMKPEQNHRLLPNLYECPTYKTLLRAGTLSTTGHSTNYVMTIELQTHKPQVHWIKRGVALFCALDY